MRVLVGLGAAVFIIVFATSLPARAQQVPDQLSLRDAEESIEAVGVLIRDEYVDANIGASVAASLREGLSEGRFPNVSTLQEVADTLNHELAFLTNDTTLRVMPATAPPGEPMRIIRDANALIIDLRDDTGTRPQAVAAAAAYVFETPGTALFEVTTRIGAVEPYRTPAVLPADAGARRWVYVLTSARTASSAEALAFLLQQQRRAEIIGETTAGVATLNKTYAVNARLQIVIPTGRIRSADGLGTWEKAGVKPDVAVTAAEALRVASGRSR